MASASAVLHRSEVLRRAPESRPIQMKAVAAKKLFNSVAVEATQYYTWFDTKNANFLPYHFNRHDKAAKKLKVLHISLLFSIFSTLMF